MDKETQRVVDIYRDKTSEETAANKIAELDRTAKGNAIKAALIPAVIGVLLFGIGMSLSLQPTNFFVLGICSGISGIALIALSWFIYTKKLSNERNAVRSEILELAEKLS